MPKKQCRICQLWKTIDCFNRDKLKADGFAKTCRQCATDYQRFVKDRVTRL